MPLPVLFWPFSGLLRVRARDRLQQAPPWTKMAETTCPVFRPTEQEFKSFRRYIEDVVDPIAGKAGLCKVIPPPGSFLSLFSLSAETARRDWLIHEV